MRVEPSGLHVEEEGASEVWQRVAQGLSPGVLPFLPSQGPDHLLRAGAVPAEVFVLPLERASEPIVFFDAEQLALVASVVLLEHEEGRSLLE